MVTVASTPRERTGTGPDAVGDSPTPPAASGEDVRDPLAAARRFGWVLFGLQLVAMLVFSTVEYHRFALTKDFAAYSQALWALSHGHLDPFSTVIGTQFWRNNGEFLMWPLSLPYRIYPHLIALLWLQAVVVVLTGVVTFHWALDVLRVRSPRVPERTAVLLAMAVPVVLVLDPWAYETIAFDFHTHVLAAFLLVLAGRDLWSGRHWRLWCWVPFILLSDAPGALYVVGLGLTGVLAGRRTRVAGASLLAAGAGWFLLLSAVGGDGVGGHGVSAWYGYLVGPHHGPVGVPDILFGALSHPGLVGHMIGQRWLLVVSFLLVVGLVGVCSPWGFGMALVVFLPSMLAAPTEFLRFTQSFQVWAALPFVLIGSLLIVLKLLANGPVGHRIAVGTLVAWGTCVVVLALVVLPTVPRFWLSVDAPAAARMAQVERSIPAGAEVVASNGVIGRFAERDEVYVLWYSAQTSQFTATVPVTRPVVVFVFAPHQGVGEVPGADQAATTYVRDHLHARVLVSGSGITALAWSPPPGTAKVTLPVDGASRPGSGAGGAAGSQSRQHLPL